MSGHSKWAQIKHKKAATDAKKGQMFSKLSRMITVAAKEKGPDPAMNPKLRMTIEKARSLGMPKENIERAIKKATEKNNKELLEEIRYEAYGPGGAALLINCVTDSKNRTTAEIKHILSQYDGKLATPGSVEWLFEKKGALTVKTNNANETDALELKLIDLGAEETERNEYDVTAYVSPAKISAFRDAVENGNIAVAEEYIAFLPKNPTDASDEETKQKIVELLETLNDHEDVQEAYSNVEFRN